MTMEVIAPTSPQESSQEPAEPPTPRLLGQPVLYWTAEKETTHEDGPSKQKHVRRYPSRGPYFGFVVGAVVDVDDNATIVFWSESGVQSVVRDVKRAERRGKPGTFVVL